MCAGTNPRCPPPGPLDLGVASQRNKKRLLCHCLTVTWQEVEDTILERGCRTVEQVTACCGAGGGCRTCHPEIQELIALVGPARGGFRNLLARLFSRKNKI